MSRGGVRPALRRAVLLVPGLVVLLAVAVAAGTFVPRPLVASEEETGSATRTIVVLSGGIHTDIAIPLEDDTRQAFAFLAGQGIPVHDPAFQWLIVGWGGRAFYLETPTWSDLKLVPALKALTIDSSVLRVDVAQAIPAGHPAIVPYGVSDENLGHLVAFIKDSFVTGEGAPAVVAGPGYGNLDLFFEAKGYFNALIGCNTWTAAALRTAGFRTGWWNPMPQSLNRSLSLFN